LNTLADCLRAELNRLRVKVVRMTVSCESALNPADYVLDEDEDDAGDAGEDVVLTLELEGLPGCAKERLLTALRSADPGKDNGGN
jgi:hypothetical protein